MTAATDGSLQQIPGPGIHPEDTTTYANLEAKPFEWDKHRIDIRMQEGAEMAAWISSQPRRGHFQKVNGIYRYVKPYLLSGDSGRTRGLLGFNDPMHPNNPLCREVFKVIGSC